MQQEPNKKREQRVTADEPDMELMKKNEHLERADRRVSALKLMSTWSRAKEGKAKHLLLKMIDDMLEETLRLSITY